MYDDPEELRPSKKISLVQIKDFSGGGSVGRDFFFSFFNSEK